MAVRFHKHEDRWVFLSAVVIFSLLASMMVAYATGYGNPSIRHGLIVSGFDSYVYLTIQKWHICYSTMRHPLLSPLLYPLALINQGLHGILGIDCKEYITAVVWVLLDSLSFLFLFKTLRRSQGIRLYDSVMLATLFFSLAYVMLAAIYPDHMALTIFTLSAALYYYSRCIRENSQPSILKASLLFIISAGITATNGIKIMIADGMASLPNIKRIATRMSILGIMALLLYGAHHLQEEHIVKPAAAARQKAMLSKMKANPEYAMRQKARWQSNATFKDKQVAKGKLFEFTDITVPRIPSLIDNVFGEGILLHREHLLQDPHGKGMARRPLFIPYSSTLPYIAEALLLMLLAAGIIIGIRDRVLWLPLSWFILDMIVHVGFNFAIHDVYIMTAHWALVFPVAISCIIRRLQHNRRFANAASAFLSVLTLYLLCHNLSLLTAFFL